MGIGFEREFLFVFGLPIWIIVRVFAMWFKKKRGKMILAKREILLNLFFVYLLCVLAVTFFPLYISWGEFRETWFSINVVPVYSTINDIMKTTGDSNITNFMMKFWVKNIGGNILLLLPLGTMLPMMWKRFESIKKTIIFGFCFSLCIEVLQLLSGFIGVWGRAFDIDDILLNTVGTFLGFIIFSKIIRRKLPSLLLDQQN